MVSSTNRCPWYTATLLSFIFVLSLIRVNGATAAPHRSGGGPAIAVAASPAGPVSISFFECHGGCGDVYGNLTVAVSVGPFSYSVPLYPDRVITENTRTLTLDTHDYMHGYGAVHLTWTKHIVHGQNLRTSCGRFMLDGSRLITLVNPRGSADLHLPFVQALHLRFGPPVASPLAPAPSPAVGSYDGIIFHVDAGSSSAFGVGQPGYVDLIVGKSSRPHRRITIAGSVTHVFPPGTEVWPSDIAPFAVTPPLTVIQRFRATAARGNFTVRRDLSAGSLDLAGGPAAVRGTTFQMRAAFRAVPNNGEPASVCGGATPAGGATRAMSVTGTLTLHLPALSGAISFPVAGFPPSSLFSSSLSVKPPPPLRVVSIMPLDRAAGVSSSLKEIRATFSNPMVSGVAELGVPDAPRPPAVNDVPLMQFPSLSADRKTLTFTLPAPLSPHLAHRVEVSGVDAWGQSTVGSATFTTG